MAWTAPRTWVANEIVTASELNVHVRDNTLFLYDKQPNTICDGRITLATGVPVPTSDQTAKTTVYFTPYNGNRVALYTGSAWEVRTFSELSLALGADAANKPYDLFGFINVSDALGIERLAWTSDTARATALATQNGVLVKSGDATRRYLGTYRTTGSAGQCEDSDARRLVWNYCNRVHRRLQKADATTSWNYTTATWRQANGAAANQIDLVVGFQEDSIDVRFLGHGLNTSGGGVTAGIGIGEDSTTAVTDNATGFMYFVTANNVEARTAYLLKQPTVGYHYYAMLEQSAATGTTTWYGTNGSAVGTSNSNSKIFALWRC